jgi:hypothetical protein
MTSQPAMTRFVPTPDQFAWTFGRCEPVMRIQPGEVLDLYTEDAFAGLDAHNRFASTEGPRELVRRRNESGHCRLRGHRRASDVPSSIRQSYPVATIAGDDRSRRGRPVGPLASGIGGTIVGVELPRDRES